jgi:hypothetical protein
MRAKRMIGALGLAFAVVLATCLLDVALQAAKPDTTPDWRCRVTFRDAASDAIRSDGAGTYVDGVGGVTCYIVNAPGTTHDRWLFMSITGTKRLPPSRYVWFPGQTFEGNSYPAFANHGTFEVFALGTVSWNPDAPGARDLKPFRAYLRHPQLPFEDGYGTVSGNSNLVGSTAVEPTSSVFVQPLDPCSWQVTSYTTEQPLWDELEVPTTRTAPRVMRLAEGNDNLILDQSIRGHFPLAFQATVVVVANKPGCSRP